MELTYKDRSEFLRGFLILIKKDNKVTESEKNMALVVGNYFGFSQDFCENAIKVLLENEYISEKPPIFSNKCIAKFFIVESYKIFNQIHTLDQNEEEWLISTAALNQIHYNTAKF